jgi:hypothetical protein
MSVGQLRYLFEELGMGLADIACGIGYPHAALRAYRSGTLHEADHTSAMHIGRLLDDIRTTCDRMTELGSADPATLSASSTATP